MKLGKTEKNHEMRHRGYLFFVEWDDGSRSYYKTRKNAKVAVGQEAGRRGLGKKHSIVKNILG